MQKVTPFLWFDNNLEEAINFYTSVFKNTEVKSINRMGADGPVFSAVFVIEGQEFKAMNAGPMFKFNEAVSFFVNCADQAEVDYYWEKLTANGGVESRCGWLKDKFGLSWQIIPDALGRLMGDPNQQKAGNVIQAMLKMNKIIVADLEAAYNEA
ncbi:MAG: VOC family protein [Sphingobacteriales bacterium JAD_PAG50586_3]|nr:MAG: VOC family protein [Sphingobacteriales bacterium JAD_PAG50586_3]